MRIVQNAYAKINWAIDVIEKRPDGYHEIDMLMQTVSLHDDMTFDSADELMLAADSPNMPRDDRNIVLRAAKALREYAGIKAGADITLKKRIPVRSGLGGGSADCAATLIALNRLWGLNLPIAKLSEIGASLGKDVPFCLGIGAARASGVGEKLLRLKSGVASYMVIVHPGIGLSTPEVYSKWDDMRDDIARVDIDSAQKALIEGDIEGLSRFALNALEPVAKLLMPEIAKAEKRFEALGSKFVRMTGSGSAVFALFETYAEAKRAAAGLGCRSIVTRTL